MKLTNPIALALCLILLAAGCSRSENAQPPALQQQTAPVEQVSTVLGNNKGRVMSSIQVAGYTYVEVETDQGVVWLAGSPTQVAEGEVVGWTEPMIMHNFTSKTLNRTFDEILFVPHLIKESDANAANPDSAPAGTEAAPSESKPAEMDSAPMPTPTLAKVLSTKSVAGYTYLETESSDGSQLWLAVPSTDVKAGQTVSWSGGAMMYNFTSKTLNRTFPEILFADGVQVVR